MSRELFGRRARSWMILLAVVVASGAMTARSPRFVASADAPALGTAATLPTTRYSSLTELDRATEAAVAAAFPRFPIEKWVGKEIIVLRRHTDLAKMGPPGHPYFYDMDGRPARYPEIEGRLFTVTVANEREIALRGENGREYVAAVDEHIIRYVLPYWELEAARKLWVGKTLWTKTFMFYGLNERTGEFGEGIDLKVAGEIKVLAIEPAFAEYSPIRFDVQDAEGRKASCLVSVHSMAAEGMDIHKRRLFGRSFFVMDPRKVVKWDADIWAKIEDHNFGKGMTDEQVLLSYGEPDKRIIKLAAQEEIWTYKVVSLRVVFRNGRVAEILQL